jgi:phage baseplate assembly protein V
MMGLPRISIWAGGRLLSAEATRALEEVRVHYALSLPAQCELAFHDPPGPLDAAADLVPGAELVVGAGDHKEALFEGEVTAVEQVYGPAGERQLRVRGYDRLHRLQKRQSVRAHVQVTPGDLAGELVADLGLDVRCQDPGPLWPRLVQHAGSDLELLIAAAEQSGLYLTLQDDILHIISLEGSGEVLSLTLGESLLEARIELSGEPACRTVTASGWNPLRVEVFEERASRPRTGREVDVEAPPHLFDSSGERELAGRTTPGSRQAEGFAQAELDWRAAHEIVLWGVAEGDPRLRPGTAVEVSGGDAFLAGRHVLTAVTHTVDSRRGYLAEFCTAPPERRDWEQASATALGQITRVDDPQNLGRVRASLPAYAGVETEWMQVMSPGAGEGKGLMLLPDVGDQVLVLLVGGQPGQGLVLGGLYGMGGAPDPGVEGNHVRRYTLRTPGGHLLRLDDEDTTVRLEDSTGSYVELSQERVVVHAEVDLVIEAPGRQVVVRGQAIDFQRA